MHLNILRTKIVNDILKDLNQDFVFVGGAIVSLYADRSTSERFTRPTKDVDVVVELASYFGYAKLEEKLRELGFKNDITSNVICRYKIQGITVDVMPTDPQVIGFSNRWYPEGFESAVPHKIDAETTVKIFTLPYFLATKWEAFKDRSNDYRTSTDFEDIVYILEHAANFEEKIKAAPAHLKAYLKDEFEKVLYTEDFNEGVSLQMSDGYHAPAPTRLINMLSTSLDIPPRNYQGYSR